MHVTTTGTGDTKLQTQTHSHTLFVLAQHRVYERNLVKEVGKEGSRLAVIRVTHLRTGTGRR